MWYEKIGLEKVKSTYWHIAKQEKWKGSQRSQYSILNLKEAEKQHKKYGFSMLQIETIDGTFNIGRISDCYFRIQQNTLANRDVMSALHDIDENRNLLLLCDKPAVEGFERVCISNRMRAAVPQLMGGNYEKQNT